MKTLKKLDKLKQANQKQEMYIAHYIRDNYQQGKLLTIYSNLKVILAINNSLIQKKNNRK
jgi:hypothetical protein